MPWDNQGYYEDPLIRESRIEGVRYIGTHEEPRPMPIYEEQRHHRPRYEHEFDPRSIQHFDGPRSIRHRTREHFTEEYDDEPFARLRISDYPEQIPAPERPNSWRQDLSPPRREVTEVFTMEPRSLPPNPRH